MAYVERENENGSDLDTNSDEVTKYYHPISAVDYDDGGGSSDGEHDTEFHQLSNGYCVHDGAENGISCLDLNDSIEQKSSDEEEREEEEEEEERRREEIQRAFREDENQRNALLTAENVTRVIEAMRGVSFSGVAPGWVAQIPEDHWIDQLRRLRRSPNT